MGAGNRILLLALCMAAARTSGALHDEKGAVTGATSTNPRTIDLHHFTLEQLQAPSEDILAAVREAVFNVGMFAVSMEPTRAGDTAAGGGPAQQPGSSSGQGGNGSDLASPDSKASLGTGGLEPASRGRALDVFGQCGLSGVLDGLLTVARLPDQTLRHTLAVASNGSTSQPLPAAIQDACPGLAAAAEQLRQSVHTVGAAYAQVLDALVPGASFSAAVQSAESLEHFHLFLSGESPAPRNSGGRPPPTSNPVLEPAHGGAERSTMRRRMRSQGGGGGSRGTASGSGSSSSSSSLIAPSRTVSMHTDIGLFIVMTAAHYVSLGQADGAGSGEARSDGPMEAGAPAGGLSDSGLRLQLPGGEVVVPSAPVGSLLVMTGEGCAQWMRADAGSELPRAAAHEVMLPPEARGRAARVWFGRMFFPPSDAVLQQRAHQRRGGPREPAAAAAGALGQLTFGEYRQQTVAAAMQGAEASAAGCSSSRSVLSDDGGACAAGELYCWMQCMSTAGLSCSKADMHCIDPSGKLWPEDFLNPVTGEPEHCLDCTAQCRSPSGGGGGGASAGQFCDPGPTPITMWMTGFQSVYKEGAFCLDFLFHGWSLDNRFKFLAAAAATFLAGVAVGGLAACRRQVLEAAKQRRRRLQAARSGLLQTLVSSPQDDPGQRALTADPPACGAKAARARAKGARDLTMAWHRTSTAAVLAALFATQTALAYALMLVAMSYQVELFAAVVAGLTAGHALFNMELWDENADACCAT